MRVKKRDEVSVHKAFLNLQKDGEVKRKDKGER